MNIILIIAYQISVICYCKSLINLDFSNFKPENVKNISHIFFGCNSLKDLNLSNLNLENVKNISFMLL